MSARERAHKLKDSYVGAVGNARQKGGGGKRGYKPPGRTDGDRTHGGGWTKPGGGGGGEFLPPERSNPQPGPGGPGRGGDIPRRPPGNNKPGPGGPGRGGDMPGRTDPGFTVPGGGGGGAWEQPERGYGRPSPGRTDGDRTHGGKRRRRNR